MSRVLIDCDGVITDCIGYLCERLPNRWPDEFKAWELEATLTPSEMKKAHRLMRTKDFVRSMPAYPHALKFLADLRKDHQVIALTANFDGSRHWANERIAWLREEAGFMSSEIVVCPASEKVYHAGDWLIEDRLSTVNEWSFQQYERGVIIDRPWNQGSTQVTVTRCKTYASALKVVNS